METDRHNSISIVECFLNSITMVNINVQVQYPREHFQ